MLPLPAKNKEYLCFDFSPPIFLVSYVCAYGYCLYDINKPPLEILLFII